MSTNKVVQATDTNMGKAICNKIDHEARLLCCARTRTRPEGSTVEYPDAKILVIWFFSSECGVAFLSKHHHNCERRRYPAFRHAPPYRPRHSASAGSSPKI